MIPLGRAAFPTPGTESTVGARTGVASAGSLRADAALVSAERRVPALALALDDEALSEAIGWPVRAARLRYKAGSGIVVGFVGAEDPAMHGWLAAYADAAKVAKTIRNARRVGAGAWEIDGWAATVAGGIDADRTLARSYARLRAAHPALCASALVVRHNPHRRLVLRAFDGERELAVKLTPRLDVSDASRSTHPEPLRRLGELGDFGERGVPILPVRRLPGVRGSSVHNWWGTGDLFSQPGTEGAVMAGRALAALHALPPGNGQGDLGGSHGGSHTGNLGQNAPARAARALALLLPELAERATRLAEVLDRRLAESRRRESAGIVHGDFSPDQVLVDAHPLAAGAVRLIDFDRSDRDVPARDLGSFAAASSLATREDLHLALLEGYLANGGTVGDSQDAWYAFGLLVRAVDPFRTRWPDWAESAEHILCLAEEAVSG